MTKSFTNFTGSTEIPRLLPQTLVTNFFVGKRGITAPSKTNGINAVDYGMIQIFISIISITIFQKILK